MERLRPAIVPVVAVLIAIAMVAAVMTGCGDDGTDQDTTASDAGATGTSTGAVTVDISTYSGDVGDLAAHADRLNSDYAGMIDDYQAGTTDVATVIATAGDYRIEFSVIVDRLQGMDPPAGLEEAHGQLIAGFGKWVRFYELQAEGLGTGEEALLDQARQLDSQAASEVNRAIESINSRSG